MSHDINPRVCLNKKCPNYILCKLILHITIYLWAHVCGAKGKNQSIIHENHVLLHLSSALTKYITTAVLFVLKPSGALGLF